MQLWKIGPIEWRMETLEGVKLLGPLPIRRLNRKEYGKLTTSENARRSVG